MQTEGQLLKDAGVADLNHDGEISDQERNIDKQVKHEADHIKQLAHAINDIGAPKGMGKWADALSDTHHGKGQAAHHAQHHNKDSGNERGR